MGVIFNDDEEEERIERVPYLRRIALGLLIFWVLVIWGLVRLFE